MRRFALLLFTLFAGCGKSHEASASGDVDTTATDPEIAKAVAQNNDLRAAQTAVDSGHPWRATQIVAATMRDAKTRTPAATLIAARAAAGWGGWSEVDKLLGIESWVDSEFGGEGRELLARSALERGATNDALMQGTRALAAAKDANARATRLVLLARALERNNQFDSAATIYDHASGELPSVRAWLKLRAAGNESDAYKRQKLLADVNLEAAKPRIPWTDAQAAERFGDPQGAAATYASIGATVPALRLRLTTGRDEATKEEVKAQLLAIVRTTAGTSDARNAVDVLDGASTILTPAEELIVARSAAFTGPWARAITGFERASREPALMTPNDRMLFAQSLYRNNRSREAMTQLAAVRGPLAGQASYQRARVLLTSGSNDATRAALRDVVTRFPNDAPAASSALYLLADLATDAGDDMQARALYQQLYRTYPASERAGAARFHAAVIAFAAGDPRTAAVELDSLVALMPRADDALAARYWSGRASAAAGDDAGAKAKWRDVIAQQPMSYYAFVAAKRLGETPWSPSSSNGALPRVAAIDSAVARAELLERLGMDTEAKFEYDALDDAASSSTDRALATAYAFASHGQASRAIRIAQKLADGGHRDARVYRVMFPLVSYDELTRNASANNLDPALVAGLIRQESSFNPHAISVANARGLMQVLPSVGEEVARTLKFPVWSPALLLDPDANLQLGTSHLAGFIKQYGALPRVLAAYNAGGSRVNRWSTKKGMEDPEIFIERIPFVETRDYVRLVMRNAAVYQTLAARH